MPIPTTAKRRTYAFQKAQGGRPSFEVMLLDCTSEHAVGRYRIQGDRQWKMWSVRLEADTNDPLWVFQKHRAIHSGHELWEPHSPVWGPITTTVHRVISGYCPSPLRERVRHVP